jgi:hypothetical protein
MSWVASIFELQDRSAPAADEIVSVGDVSRYRFAAASDAPADGIYVVAPRPGGGRWLRMGPPGLVLTEAALGARPSRARVRASGEGGSLEVDLTAPADFADGDAVVIHNAGASCDLTAPGRPVLRARSSGSRTLRYAAVAVAEDRSFTGAGEAAELADAPDRIETASVVEVDWDAASVDPAAHLLIVYRQIDDGEWEPIGGLVANPHRLRDTRLVREPIRLQLVDDGRSRLAGLAPWLPSTIPREGGRGQILTRIVRGGGSRHLTLEHPLQAEVDGVEFRHDAGMPFQRAIDAFRGRRPSDGGRLHIPAGEFELNMRVRIDKRCLVEGDGRNQTRLVLMDGWGIEIEGQHTSRAGTSGQQSLLRDFTITYSSTKTVPAGNPVALLSLTPEEAATSVEEWFSGAVVLVTAQCELHSVAVQNGVGSGFVFYGWPALPDGSAETNCNVSLVVSCSVSGTLGHGFATRGDDANQIAFIQANAVGCAGWGFADRSFLGTHFYATHAAANQRGAYLTTADVAASTYVGAYSERAQPVSSAAQGTIIVGGMHGARWRSEERSLKIYQFDRPGIQPGIHLHHADGSTSSEFGHWKASVPQLRRYGSTHPTARLNHVRDVVRRGDHVRIRDYYARARLVGREWLGSYVRGSGLIRYPRGALWGGERAERRVAMVNGLPSEFGVYDVGDVLFDAAQEALCYRPRRRFALGSPWAPGRETHVGDVVTPSRPDGFAYVAATIDEPDQRGDTGDTEPDPWPAAEGATITDGAIVWQCWGIDRPDLATIAPRPHRVPLAFGTVAAGASTGASARVDRLRAGDATLAVPSTPLAPDLLVTSSAPTDDTVEVRLRNMASTDLVVPDQTWTIHVLPS